MQPIYRRAREIKLLEEITDWKRKEQAHAELILKAAPELEPAYAELIQQWEPLFRQTVLQAGSLLEETTRQDAENNGAAGRDTEDVEPNFASGADADGLLKASAMQTGIFMQQLLQMMGTSPALAQPSAARSAVDYVLRESTYYLGKAETWTHRETANEAGRPWFHETPAQQELQEVPIGGHSLPPLPYAYNALEPYIDETTMRIHHDKHHLAYVNDLNKAEKELLSSRKTGDFDLVKHWERELAFNGAGHYLHTLFWTVMSPVGGGRPNGPLADAIDRDFDSFDAFKKQFSEAAAKVEGSGWAILVWSPRSRRLEILQAEKHQNLSQWDVIPLLPLDVWEHAYYLKHQNKRPDYIKDWWNVVNWPYVSKRFESARTIAWEPY